MDNCSHLGEKYLNCEPSFFTAGRSSRGQLALRPLPWPASPRTLASYRLSVDHHEQLFFQCQPEQGGVLPGPEEVLDEHPVVQLERERLHGVVDDRHLKQKSNVK